MFCSFFDLSGNPPRISATKTMSLELNSGRIILLDLIRRSAARILFGPVHEAEVGAAHRVAFEARGCHPDHGRKWESSTLAQRQKSRLVDATRRWASWTPICSRSACCPILGCPDYRVDRHQFFEFLIAEPALTKYVIYILCAER